MKPKDLPRFFSFEERRPLFHEGMMCIPRYFMGHDPSLLPSFKEIFTNNAPIEIEFCSGNGEWIARCAEENPHINYIAVEMKFARARQIWAKKQNNGLANLLVVCGAAEDFCEHYLPENFASSFYINFPDPWPKKRHAKHRIIKKEFLERLFKVGKGGAPLWLVTDDEPYAKESLEIFQAEANWKEGFPFPHFIETCDEYGSSYFNRLWIQKGKTIRYIKYMCDK